MVRKLLVLSLFFLSSTLYPSSRSYLSLPLKYLKSIATYFQTRNVYDKHGSENAAPFYQKVGNEAHNLVGTVKRYPIKKLAPKSPLYENSYAITSDGIPFVNEEKTTPDIARPVLIHETYHQKQYYPEKSTYVVQNPEFQHVEEEADMQGVLLGNCYKCTRAFAKKAPSIHDNSPESIAQRKKGYAIKERLLQIAQNQEHQKALCAYHQNNG